jgi:hypothetical protein
MADEVRIQSQGPDGNGLQLDLREKKLGLTGPNVALLLLILIIGGVAWLRTGTIDKTLKGGQEQIAATEGRVHQHVAELFGRIDTLLHDLQQQTVVMNANNAKVTEGQHALRTHLDEALVRQDQLVHRQTEAIEALVKGLTQYVEAWFSEMGRRLELLNHNIAHPDKALPLRAPVPREEREPERGR